MRPPTERGGNRVLAAVAPEPPLAASWCGVSALFVLRGVRDSLLRLTANRPVGPHTRRIARRAAARCWPGLAATGARLDQRATRFLVSHVLRWGDPDGLHRGRDLGCRHRNDPIDGRAPRWPRPWNSISGERDQDHLLFLRLRRRPVHPDLVGPSHEEYRLESLAEKADLERLPLSREDPAFLIGGGLNRSACCM